MRYIITIIAVVFFASCQNIKKPQKPENLIAKDKMIDVYLESYLTSASRSVDNKTLRDSGIKLDSFIYARFEIDSLQFAKSHAYYTTDLESYMEMFREVERRLLELQKKYVVAPPADGKQNNDSTTKQNKLLTKPQVTEEDELSVE